MSLRNEIFFENKVIDTVDNIHFKLRVLINFSHLLLLVLIEFSWQKQKDTTNTRHVPAHYYTFTWTPHKQIDIYYRINSIMS